MTQKSLSRRAQGACHKLVASTAMELAGALYEDLAKDNEFYRRNPSQKRFIKKYWSKLVPQARATLADILARPGNENLKPTIADALILDNTLRRMPG